MPKVVASKDSGIGWLSPLTKGEALAIWATWPTRSSKAWMKRLAGVKQIRLSSTQA